MNDAPNTLLPLDIELADLVHATGRWTVNACAELTHITQRIGPDALAHMTLPWKALKSAVALKTLIDAGMQVAYTHPTLDIKAHQHIRTPEFMVGAREAAARQDASADVHRVLDACGVPPVSEVDATKWGVWIATHALLNSLAYLFDAQPDVMKGTATGDRALLPLFLGRAWENRRESNPKKAQALLMFGLAHNATWDTYIHGLRTSCKSLLPVFEGALAAASSAHLADVVGAAPARTRHRL